ncbi:XdhC family protein [Halobaculum sp. D14]|uniref:XdhC family protein n=1 Tax=unclassified Halobaculum TaxID=2640896 RepID=UPI003EBFA83B
MSVYRTAADLADAGETVALATVTAVEGSTPRDPGATMLVREDGSTDGTIGGGTVEELTRTAAVEAIEEREPRTEHWELRRDGNTGMVCGGEMTVFIDVVVGAPRLVVAGGGHIAVPLARMADEMGYEVCVVDDREEFADPERFPDAEVFCGDYDDGIAEFGVTSNTAVAIASRSGTFDRIAAQEALERDAYYVGLVASDDKADHVRDGLLDDGVDEDALERLHAPVGLDVGGGDPADVALSILAELNRVRHGKPASVDAES